jgi:hypothetical protein
VRKEQACGVSHGRFDERRVRQQCNTDCNAKQQVEHEAGDEDLRPKLACSDVVQAAKARSHLPCDGGNFCQRGQPHVSNAQAPLCRAQRAQRSV